MLIFLQATNLRERRIANIFNPLGTPATEQYRIALFTIAIAACIFVVVSGLLTYTIIRFRRRGDDNSREEPPQVYGSNQIEMAWTFMPILCVFVLIGVAARFIMAIQNAKLPPETEQITVIGHQWWWEVQYPKYGVVTANEIHIPIPAEGSTPVRLTLESVDVIHSFWVPQLSGKTDLIPNRINTMWIDAHQPGIYFGNCAEYCGTQHANMLLRVFAEPRTDFDEWIRTEQPAADISAARQTFESLSCVNCHRVRGTRANGTFGPDLTHLMSRTTIAAGMLRNTMQNLQRWVADPQTMKPGCLMPSMKLTGNEVSSVVSYLETLK